MVSRTRWIYDDSQKNESYRRRTVWEKTIWWWRI